MQPAAFVVLSLDSLRQARYRHVRPGQRRSDAGDAHGRRACGHGCRGLGARSLDRRLRGRSESILFAATYPERAWALALCGTFASERWAPDYPFGIRDEEARREDEEIERNWGTTEAAAAVAQSLAPSASAEEQQALAAARTGKGGS